MKIDGRFLPLPEDLISSPSWQVAPPPAIKILIAIATDWVMHGCRDNGNLIVSYKAIILATAINDRHAISLALRQLEALGLLMVNRGKPLKRANRYGLPWLPGHNGGPPTRQWLEITSKEDALRCLAGLKRGRKDRPAERIAAVKRYGVA